MVVYYKLNRSKLLNINCEIDKINHGPELMSFLIFVLPKLNGMALIKSISGIRGTIGGKPNDNLTPVDIVKFTAAYGSWLLQQSINSKVIIGRDGRISGEMVSNLVVNTLIGLGFDIIDLGLSTTPTVEMAVKFENAAGGIILTA